MGRSVATGPSPLEVVTTQPASYIHHLADKVQAWNFARLECFGLQISSADSAPHYLGFFVAFRATGHQLPGCNSLRQGPKLFFPQLRHFAPGKRLQFGFVQPGLHQTLGLVRHLRSKPVLGVGFCTQRGLQQIGL